MYVCELDYKETESQKIDVFILCFYIEEDSWESLGQGDQPVYPKGNQSWIYTGRTDAEGEAPILWAPDVNN